jgi:predicted DNA-binding protein (MmcQ/YjbR family)
MHHGGTSGYDAMASTRHGTRQSQQWVDSRHPALDAELPQGAFAKVDSVSPVEMRMSLFEPESFESFTISLPGVSLVDQWESRVAKVGGKVFTLLRLTSPDLHSIVFKCPEESFIVLTGIEGVKQAPHFAKGQWVCVPREADLSDAELEAYLRRSYRLVAAGLTKKVRQELGISLE